MESLATHGYAVHRAILGEPKTKPRLRGRVGPQQRLVLRNMARLSLHLRTLFPGCATTVRDVLYSLRTCQFYFMIRAWARPIQAVVPGFNLELFYMEADRARIVRESRVKTKWVTLEEFRHMHGAGPVTSVVSWGGVSRDKSHRGPKFRAPRVVGGVGSGVGVARRARRTQHRG